MRYFVLNISVLIVLLFWTCHKKIPTNFRRSSARAMLLVSTLTLIFDPLIIAAGIVAYNRQYTLGINFWQAPVEDIAYALAAAVLIPLLWKQYEKQ